MGRPRRFRHGLRRIVSLRPLIFLVASYQKFLRARRLVRSATIHGEEGYTDRNVYRAHRGSFSWTICSSRTEERADRFTAKHSNGTTQSKNARSYVDGQASCTASSCSRVKRIGCLEWRTR